MTLRFCSLREPAVVDGLADRLVEALDQAVRDGDAGDERQVALGDAERHVDAPVSPQLATMRPPRRISPFGLPRGAVGPRISLSGGGSK